LEQCATASHHLLSLPLLPLQSLLLPQATVKHRALVAWPYLSAVHP
jgi:hypothetical protein